jgi:hypothetical protein
MGMAGATTIKAAIEAIAESIIDITARTDRMGIGIGMTTIIMGIVGKA